MSTDIEHRLPKMVRKKDKKVIVDGLIARVQLSRGLVAIIDAEDAPRVREHGWWAGNNYAYRGADQLALHHFIMGDRRLYDHRNRNGFDCRKENLRPCTYSQNNRNRAGRSKTCPFKGVRKNAGRNRWVANVYHKGKKYFLGSYDTAEDAAIVFNVASQILGDEFTYLNPV